MKQLTYVLTFFICGCQGQSINTEYKFSSIGWTVKVPEEFEIINSKKVHDLNKGGKSLVQDAYSTDAHITDPNTLICFRKGEGNTFVCNITRFDTTEDGSWLEHIQFLKDVIFKTTQTSTKDLENVHIDTSSTTVLIDERLFNKIKLKLIIPNRKTIYWDLLSILKNGYDVGITIVYQDENVAQKFYDILNKSKFY